MGSAPVTVSIGGFHSDLVGDSREYDAFYRGADEALYAAKEAGRDRVVMKGE